MNHQLAIIALQDVKHLLERRIVKIKRENTKPSLCTRILINAEIEGIEHSIEEVSNAIAQQQRLNEEYLADCG